MPSADISSSLKPSMRVFIIPVTTSAATNVARRVWSGVWPSRGSLHCWNPSSVQNPCGYVRRVPRGREKGRMGGRHHWCRLMGEGDVLHWKSKRTTCGSSIRRSLCIRAQVHWPRTQADTAASTAGTGSAVWLQPGMAGQATALSAVCEWEPKAGERWHREN